MHLHNMYILCFSTCNTSIWFKQLLHLISVVQVGPLMTSVGIGCTLRPPKVLTSVGREDNDSDHEMNVSNIEMYKPEEEETSFENIS